MPIDTSLLRPVAPPQPFNFAALEQSMLQGQARDTNLSAGDLAAQGNYSGAAARAFQGGNAPLAGQMFDVGNAQHVAGLKSAIAALTPVNSPSDWNKARASIIRSGGQDPGDFSQKDKVIGQLTDALDPEAAANRKVQMAVLNKPSIERTVDPITGQVSFVRVNPYGGSAQPVGMGGQPSDGMPPPATGQPQAAPGAMPPPATPSAAPGDRFGNYFDPAKLQQAGPTVSGAPVGSASAPAANSGPAFDPAVEDAISRIPQAYQGPLRGLLNYSVDPRLERAAGRGGLIAMAQQVDPTYNPANFPARASAIKDATSGKMASANNSLNTGIGHLNQLVDAVAGLNNGNFTPGNAAANAWKTLTGDPAVTNFKSVADRVAPEITRIWRGVGGNESDIARDLTTLSSAGSPAQLYGAIGNIAKMMQSKIDSNQYQYEQAVPGRPLQMIKPEAEAVIAKLEALANGQAPPSKGSAPQGAPPQTAAATAAAPVKLGPNGEGYDTVQVGGQYVAPDGSVRTRSR